VLLPDISTHLQEPVLVLNMQALFVWSSIKTKGPDPGLNKLKFDLAGIALGKHLARLWVLNSGTNRWL
jgi:hypothetical protein